MVNKYWEIVSKCFVSDPLCRSCRPVIIIIFFFGKHRLHLELSFTYGKVVENAK